MYVSLDGTDFRIMEPKPFNRKWYSHKFKGPGLRYEIGVSIGSGHIVWQHGPFPCGSWPDSKIAKECYIHDANNEITLADKGYRGIGNFKIASEPFEKRILARHETLNGRLKNFKALGSRFRHKLNKHPFVFNAILNIVQATITNGNNLFVL